MVHRSVEQDSALTSVPRASFLSRAIASVSDFFHLSPSFALSPQGDLALSEIGKAYVQDEIRRAISAPFSFTLKNAAGSPLEEIGTFHWMTRQHIPIVQQLQVKSGQFVKDAQYFEATLTERSRVSMRVDVGERTVAGAIYRLNHFDVNLEVVVVDPEFQRRGIGTKLLGMIESLSAGRRIEMIFDVSDENLAGHLWLNKIGFQAATVIHSDSTNDQYRFVRPITWR